jgi:hypothetical protein
LEECRTVNAPHNQNADSARLAIAEQLSTIRTLLRLLDPSSPFQPILVGSIDLVAWQAFFGQAVEAIETSLPQALSPLPLRAQQSISTAASTLFSLAHSVCDAPQLHMSEQAAELDALGLLPEGTGLEPDPLRSSEEHDIVEAAVRQSVAFHDQTAPQRALQRRALDDSTQKLIKALTQKHGLAWLLRARCKQSKQFASQFQGLADRLESALASPAPSSKAPWNEADRWFCRLTSAVELHLLPELDSILKETAPRSRPIKARRSGAATPKRQSIKDALLRSWDSFLQAHTAARNVAAAHAAYTLWALFSVLVASLSDCLRNTGLPDRPTHHVESKPRLIDAIAAIDERIISRHLLAEWNEFLGCADAFTMQIVLASLHHLERPDDQASGIGNRSLIYAFSEQTAARWFSRGNYPGAIPDREASTTFAAEKKRTRRALENLRRHKTAFHGRRNWTPLLKKVLDSATERLWTMNPILAAHSVIKQEATRFPAADSLEIQMRDDRPRPTRRNRQARRTL